MISFDAKRIADPVHGTIGLSELEVEIIGTPAFQRLRNVRQLGLAHYVFPGADYSRFSHSLGVCHVAGRIMASLRKDSSADISDEEVQEYRLAALLHDVGHYPFSHAMEEAVKNYFAGSLFESTTGAEAEGIKNNDSVPIEPYNHERLGKEIVSYDASISHLLTDGGFPPERIYAIFLREEPPKYANLVSSDLDADRIDYLLRTAHHTGLPYGAVDLDYLLSQLRIDQQKRICLTEKALRTADHFLLCRYFDYQQVAFHKTVASLELVLKDVLNILLENQLVDCSPQILRNQIKSGDWQTFDDAHILNSIRQLLIGSNLDAIDTLKAKSILLRDPPKLIADKEVIRTQNDRNSFHGEVQSVKSHLAAWAKEFNIDPRLWYVWNRSTTLTKIGSRIPVSERDLSQKDADKYDQAVRILSKTGADSQPIVELRHSLMSVLSEYELEGLRVYVLLPEGKQQERKRIAARIKADLPFIGWKE